MNLQPPDPPEEGLCPRCMTAIHRSQLAGEGCTECAHLPDIGTCWQHTNGAWYNVRFYTNQCSTNPKYPLTIVYEGAGGNLWSRPADDWHRSMTAVKP